MTIIFTNYNTVKQLKYFRIMIDFLALLEPLQLS